MSVHIEVGDGTRPTLAPGQTIEVWDGSILRGRWIVSLP